MVWNLWVGGRVVLIYHVGEICYVLACCDESLLCEKSVLLLHTTKKTRILTRDVKKLNIYKSEPKKTRKNTVKKYD